MMKRTRREVRPLGTVALILLAAAGCGDPGGDDLPREAISGSVTFDGKPLANGTIQFQPASQAEGMAAGGMVVDGQFDVPRSEGPVPGNYKVQIDSLEGTVDVPAPEPAASADEDVMPGALKIPPKKMVRRRLIPPRYNSQSELTVEVKSGGPNVHEFVLEK